MRRGTVLALTAFFCSTLTLVGCQRETPTSSRMSDHSEFAVLAPPPRSLDQITSRMSVVVRGQYVEVLEVRSDPVPVPTERVAELGATTERGAPYSLLRFVVTEYIVGTGPNELTLVQAGDLRDAGGFEYGIARPKLGEEITLIAQPWPGHAPLMVPVNADYGRFTEVDGRLSYAWLDIEKRDDPSFSAVPFAEGMTLEQFHDALRDAARGRGLVVPER
jgi:hypothetical protein